MITSILRRLACTEKEPGVYTCPTGGLLSRVIIFPIDSLIGTVQTSRVEIRAELTIDGDLIPIEVEIEMHFPGEP